MGTDVVRLDLSPRRRSLIGYSLGLAVYVLVVVALYPAFKGTTSLDEFVKGDATAAALFGVTGDLSSSGGWLNGNVYANFFPLVMVLLTIGYGAAAIAGQDEDGTLCLLATLPRRRATIIEEKATAMAVQATTLAVVVGACVTLGRTFELTSSVAHIASTSAAVALLGIDFGLLALTVGAWRGRRGDAIGVAAGVAATSYLASSLASVVSWLRPAREASLFYWSVGHNQISRGVSVGDFAVLAGVGAGMLVAAVVAFRRLDLH